MPIIESALRTYLIADPDNLGLAEFVASGNDGEIVARINMLGKTRTIEISCYKAYRYLVGRQLWRGIVAVANDAGHPAHSAACAAVDLIAPGADIPVDFCSPHSQPMLATLDAAGLLGRTGRSDLEAMCTIPATYGEVAGIGIIDHVAVSRAMRG